MKLGIDVGGTFTDFVYLTGGGEIRFSKVLTTYPPDHAIRQGLHELGIGLDKFSFVSHGTTLGLNAFVTRRGAKTALVTTAGFRDILEIGRTRRFSIYDLFQEKADPVLIPRNLRLEVTERVDANGQVLKEINDSEIEKVTAALIESRVDAVAVCLLNSYANPTHEKRISKAISLRLPRVFLSVSSEVLPEYREYERMFATSLNSYIGPIMSKYFDAVEEIFRKGGYEKEIFVSQSNGGLMSTHQARKIPVFMMECGPAMGVLGGLAVARSIGVPNFICMDMGGTTCLASSVVDFNARIVSETRVGNRLKLPRVDVSTIGAGGGSIAWMDHAGLMHVGPQSAAADPGPACYGLGGLEPTVTDANLLLGYIDPDYFLGGRRKVYREKAERAFELLASKMNSDAKQAAKSTLKIVDSNMVNNLREVTVWRGYDPREFVLLAFGGGSGLHVVRMARNLGIGKVISPRFPALVSALGNVVADVKHYYSRTYYKTIEESDPSDIRNFYDEIEDTAKSTLLEEGVGPGDTVLNRSFDMKYQSQFHELEVDVNAIAFTVEGIKEIAAMFHTKHRDAYGYSSGENVVEIVNLKLEAIGKSARLNVTLSTKGKREMDLSSAIRGRRKVHLLEGDNIEVNCWDREKLSPGDAMEGPALIDGLESTLWLPSESYATVDDHLNIVIKVGA